MPWDRQERTTNAGSSCRIQCSSKIRSCSMDVRRGSPSQMATGPSRCTFGMAVRIGSPARFATLRRERFVALRGFIGMLAPLADRRSIVARQNARELPRRADEIERVRSRRRHGNARQRQDHRRGSGKIEVDRVRVFAELDIR